MRATLATVVLGMLALAPGAAAAQPMTPTENQRAHNDRGVQHMFDGEFEQAAASFKASLAMGESNIVWLNYGRALFKLQRCHEARTAFERVPAAPEVVAPSPEEIAVVLDRFSVEWSAECSGRLSLECRDHSERHQKRGLASR